ncbi:hypothetical protein [Natrialba aegyptia]|uniref:Uncharacterized protein n=1 Tax=Natrialba aegyptia DSM 13077 TaxID=1227491 RepID=M0ATT4_9EURY|nr:hypothetical protein [Natrialba aegyptia]ELZ01348.1 hypothetical protein C480_18177 [Natrialba aegyptia DSM 13077]
MDNGLDVSQQYTFSPPIDLLSALESLHIQYLDVTETRALVIFKAAILNLESNEGTLTTLSGAEITVYELPRHTTTDDPENEASSVIEKFIDQITSAEMTTASRHE